MCTSVITSFEQHRLGTRMRTARNNVVKLLPSAWSKPPPAPRFIVLFEFIYVQHPPIRVARHSAARCVQMVYCTAFLERGVMRD